MLECKNCGAPVGSDWRFCRNCGSALTPISQEDVATRTFEPKSETSPGRAEPTAPTYVSPEPSWPQTGGWPYPPVKPRKKSRSLPFLVLIGVLFASVIGGAGLWSLRQSAHRRAERRGMRPIEQLAREARPVQIEDRTIGPFSRQFVLAFGSDFSLSNVNGDVTISTWNEERAAITATKRAGSPGELRATTIKITGDAKGLSIETGLPRDSSVAVDYEIKLPSRVHLRKIGATNGSVSVSGVEGNVKVKTTNGNVRVENVAGRVETETVNGDTSVNLPRLEGDEINVTSVNGSIQLEIPEESNADVAIDTVNGDIRTDPSFNLTVRRSRIIGRQARGRIGSGGTSIKLNNVNGNITLTRARP